MKLITPILITFLLTSTVTTITQAKERDPNKIISHISEKLDLADEQQNSLRSFFDSQQQLRKERKAKRTEKKESRKRDEKPTGAIAELMQKKQISLDELNEIIDLKHSTKREKIQPSLVAFIEFRNSLTPTKLEQAHPILMRMFGSIMGKRKKNMQRKTSKKQ